MSENLSFCRLCAKKFSDTILIKMNSEKFVNCNLAERIHQYFIISITESDILPRDVCNNCCQKVLETYEFHQDILKAQEFLEKETFHQTKLEIKDEDTDKFFEESYNSMLDSNNSFAEDSLDGEPLIKRDGRKSTEYKGKIKTKILFDQLNKETEENIKNESINEEITFNGHTTKKRKKRKKLFVDKKCISSSEELLVNQELRNVILCEGEDEPSYVCHICGKFYISQSGLSSHLKCHNGEKLFQCNMCPKQYKYITSLQEHKLCHTNLRPHICPVCGLTFRTKRTLDRHSLVHNEILNYPCTFCPKRFKKKYSLTIHLRLHTGERPYSCTECNHFFANDSNFIKHLKGRHGLQNVSIVKKRQYPNDFE